MLCPREPLLAITLYGKFGPKPLQHLRSAMFQLIKRQSLDHITAGLNLRLSYLLLCCRFITCTTLIVIIMKQKHNFIENQIGTNNNTKKRLCEGGIRYTPEHQIITPLSVARLRLRN